MAACKNAKTTSARRSSQRAECARRLRAASRAAADPCSVSARRLSADAALARPPRTNRRISWFAFARRAPCQRLVAAIEQLEQARIDAATAVVIAKGPVVIEPTFEH